MCRCPMCLRHPRTTRAPTRAATAPRARKTRDASCVATGGSSSILPPRRSGVRPCSARTAHPVIGGPYASECIALTDGGLRRCLTCVSGIAVPCLAMLRRCRPRSAPPCQSPTHSRATACRCWARPSGAPFSTRRPRAHRKVTAAKARHYECTLSLSHLCTARDAWAARPL